MKLESPSESPNTDKVERFLQRKNKGFLQKIETNFNKNTYNQKEQTLSATTKNLLKEQSRQALKLLNTKSYQDQQQNPLSHLNKKLMKNIDNIKQYNYQRPSISEFKLNKINKNRLFQKSQSVQELFSIQTRQKSQQAKRKTRKINLMMSSQDRPKTSFQNQLLNNKKISQDQRPFTAFQSTMTQQYYGQSEIQNSENRIDLKLATAKQKLRLKPQLSVFTKSQNEELDDQISQLNNLQNQIDKKKSFAYFEKINCQNLLLKTNREIKCLNYELMNVVQINDDHTILAHMKPNDLEIIQETLMSFKVKVKDQPSPARFRIFYKPKQIDSSSAHANLGDLKVFCSFFNKEPKENSSMKTYQNPDRFIIANNKSEFDTECIYLSFYSIQGCSITVTVNFPEAQSPTKIKKKQKKEKGENQEDDNKQNDLNVEDELQKFMNRQQKSNVDFINKNIDQIHLWDQKQNQKMFQIKFNSSKMQQNKNRRIDIEDQRRN